MFKVNLIIPTFQRTEYLLSLLRDITHQTYSNFCVWVCSDGPDLKAFEMVMEFNSKYPQAFNYIHLVKHIGDWGITPRKEVLKDIPSDELVCFIDDDNSISNKYLETLIYPFQQDPQLDISFAQVYLADHEINGERIIPISQLHPESYFSYGYIDPLCMMIRASVAQKYISSWGNLRDQDYPFIIKCMQNSKFYITCNIVGVHR